MKSQNHTPHLPRRDALKSIAGIVGTGVLAGITNIARAAEKAPEAPMIQPMPLPAAVPETPRTKPRIGVQMEPWPFYDDGIEYTFDHMQREGAIDTIFVNTHSYYFPERRTVKQSLQRPDAPPPSDPRQLTPCWIPWRKEFYSETPIPHLRDPETQQYADRDLLAELLPPARARGMKVFARHLEGFREGYVKAMPALQAALSIDCYGKTHSHYPCWNHPHYRAWWHAQARELASSYEIDGWLLGPERGGFFGPLFHNGTAPICFCEHCKTKARSRNIDSERARHGAIALHQLMLRSAAMESIPEGVFNSALRLLLQFPEVTAWEQLQVDSQETLHRELSEITKSIRPGFQIARHIPVYGLGWDIFARATTDYASLAEYTDIIKPSLYFRVHAPRIHDWMERSRKNLYRDFSPEALLSLLYSVNNYNPATEPTAETLATRGMSPAYSQRETLRAVSAVQNHAAIWGGIGLDIPHKGPLETTREDLIAHTQISLSAGATGILLSREYHFMRPESLRAVRDAVAEWTKPSL